LSYLDTNVVVSLIVRDNNYDNACSLINQESKPLYISTWVLAEAVGVLSRELKGRYGSGYENMVEDMEEIGIPLPSLSKYIYLMGRLVEAMATYGIKVRDDPMDESDLVMGDSHVKTFWAMHDAAVIAAGLGLKASDALHLAYIKRLGLSHFLTLDKDFTHIKDLIHDLGIEVHGLP